MRSFGRAARVVAVVCLMSIASVSNASELNNSMQLFFEGKVEQSHQMLSALIRQGHSDARIFYFRGLANHRLGHAKAAVSDFQRAADLELSTSPHGVGQALQRVQGTERLLLEKYRTMARLVNRQRTQPIAPKPVVYSSDNVGSQLTASQPPPLVAPRTAPRFRLASEIPVREQIGDPFTSNNQGMLAGETPPKGPTVVPSANSDKPVGTGVVQTSGTADDQSDPFADDEFTSEAPRASGSDAGVFGAVFRAIRKATIPQVDPTQLVPGIPGGGPGFNGGPGPAFEGAGPGEDADPFGDDAGFGGFDEDDPFGE